MRNNNYFGYSMTAVFYVDLNTALLFLDNRLGFENHLLLLLLFTSLKMGSERF